MNFSKWRGQSTQRCRTEPDVTAASPGTFRAFPENSWSACANRKQYLVQRFDFFFFFLIQIKSTSQTPSHILDIPVHSRSYLSVSAALIFVGALSIALFWDLWAALMPWNSGRDNDKALLSSSTQPLQVPLESDIFLKPKVVSDFAPPALGINSRQIMWDMSYGRANLSSATRHKSSIPWAGILPHNWGLFCLQCRAGAAENELLKHLLQMSCWGRRGHALEIPWLQEAIWEFLTALPDKEINLSGARNTLPNPQ